MDEASIIAGIDEEIGRLRQARALLAGGNAATIATEVVNLTKRTAKRRRLSPAARKRISAAQKKRWTAAKAEPVKATPAKRAAKKAQGAVAEKSLALIGNASGRIPAVRPFCRSCCPEAFSIRFHELARATLDEKPTTHRNRRVVEGFQGRLVKADSSP